MRSYLMGFLFTWCITTKKQRNTRLAVRCVYDFSGDVPNYTTSKPGVSIMALSSEEAMRFVVESSTIIQALDVEAKH